MRFAYPPTYVVRPGGCALLTHPTYVVRPGGCASLTHPTYKLAGLPLTDPQKLPVRALDCAINRHTARVGLQSPGATDIMRPARLTTLSMGALLVLPQRYSVYQVRSGRKQPRQMTCVPGCSWQSPHPFLPLPAAITCFDCASFKHPLLCFSVLPTAIYFRVASRFILFCRLNLIILSFICHLIVIIAKPISHF